MPIKTEINNSMALYRGYNTVNNNTPKTRLEDSDLIKRDLANHFNIRKGEKLMRPDFGTIIWDALFEPMTEDLRDAIVDDATRIINYDPRLIPDSILVDEYDQGIIIELRVRFRTTNQAETLKFLFDQNLNSVVFR
jgi:phage baseplate assembly protein W